mgnify:CR=1 FL=1
MILLNRIEHRKNERLVKLVGNMTYIKNNIYVIFYEKMEERK